MNAAPTAAVRVDDGWLIGAEPERWLVARRLDDVPAVLAAAEEEAARGRVAVGYLAYEAGPAFDPAIAARLPGGLPLAAFAVFPALERADALAAEGEWELGAWEEDLPEAAYLQAVERVRGAIRDGETYQVNLTFRLRSPFAGSSWAFFAALSAAHEAPYAAYLDLGRFVICSASPELFLEADGSRLRSRPMKGTARRHPDPRRDLARGRALRRSAKERAENLMIVDMVRNDLGRVAWVGSVQVPHLFALERYPTVWQMTSTVEAESDRPLAEVVAALFPPASVTGAPKVRATELIRELEASPRGVYTGAMGLVGPGRRARLNVAIRTAVIDRRTATLSYGVGSGIVWDSRPRRELAECRLKAAVLGVRPREFRLLETMRWDPRRGFVLWAEHVRRLRRSAKHLGFRFDGERIAAEAREAAAAWREPMRVRLLLDRCGRTTWEAVPLRDSPFPARVRLALAKAPVPSGELALYHKSTERSQYVAAWDGVDREAVDDVLLWNERGEVTETTVANVVVELDGELVTPPVRCGLLDGTLRRMLVRRGIVRERVVRLEDLERCRRLWVVNSVRGWRFAQLLRTEAGRGADGARVAEAVRVR